MFDALMLALLAGAFAALAGFVWACEALTRRDAAGGEGRP